MAHRTPAVADAVLRVGQRVFVHANLHTGGFSVTDPRRHRVIAHVDDITLTRVEFRFRPACVRRLRAERRRRVCAYAVGIIETVNTAPAEQGIRIAYNPFLRPDFHHSETGERVDHAERCVFVNTRAYLPLA